MKKTLALVLALLVLFTYTAFADEVMIEKTVYKGNGIVDVDFFRDVRYENMEITVQDANGNACEVTVLERDDDDVDFRVSNLVPGGVYSYTITGVRSGIGGSFGSVSGSFSVPQDEAHAIKKVEFDRSDRELDVELFAPANLQGANMTITDASGKVYEYKIREVERDGFEAYVPDLQWGETYTIEITGVNGNESYVPFTFVAVDN